MVHALICCQGTRGDIQPFVAMALGLMAAGEEVLMLVPEEYASFVMDFGIPTRQYSKSLQVATLTTEDGQALCDGGEPYTDEAVQATTHDLFKPLFRTWFHETLHWFQRSQSERLVLTQWLWLAGCFVIPSMCKHKAKVLFAHLIPGHLTSEFAQPTSTSGTTYALGSINRYTWWLSDTLVLQGLYRQLALKAIAEVAAHKQQPAPELPLDFGMSACTNLYAYSRHLLPKPYDWPEECRVTGALQLPAVEYSGPMPEGMEQFIADAAQEGIPLVFAGFGSMLDIYFDPPAARAVGDMLLQAFRQVQEKHACRFLVQAGESVLKVGQLPFRSATVKAMRDEGLACVWNYSFPHTVLFPYCQLVLCHGGIGTLQTAMAAGAPVCALPSLSPSDQPFWADAVHKKGLGPLGCPLTEATADKITAIIIDALDNKDQYSSIAQAMGSKMLKEDGVAQAVAFVIAGV